MPVLRGAMKERLSRGEVALGLAVSGRASVGLAPLARAAGYDWLILDREHGAASMEAAGELSIAAGLCGLTPVVRTALSGLDEATRALDSGAQGVLVPRVETRAEARRIVEACRYPPTGRRSWGAAFAQANAGPIPEAMTEAEASTAVLAMIETPAGVENAGTIAAETGVDAIFVGVLDLTIELGAPGDVHHPDVTAAVEAVARACQRAGKPFGVGGVGDEDWTRWAFDLGARLLVGGSDQGLLFAAATARARALRALEGRPASAP